MKSNKRGPLGQFIRSRREALGLSQKGLGLQLSPPVTTQFISNIERGVTPLPLSHLPAVAKGLAVAESELVVLLEQEYGFRLSTKLVSSPSLQAEPDLQYVQEIFRAFRSADPSTRKSFVETCSNLFKIPAKHE